MKKSFLIFLLFCLTSCSDNGDRFVGDWINSDGDIRVNITKAGEYYSINRREGHSIQSIYNDYCIFEKGCFKYNANKKEILLCADSKGLLIYKGSTLNKK
jgi:hypothetical protein